MADGGSQNDSGAIGSQWISRTVGSPLGSAAELHPGLQHHATPARATA